MTSPLRMGLVGAGPWATVLTGPMLANAPEIDLRGVWARRPEAADALATQLGTTGFADLDALFDECEAVMFSVPPDVQAALAARAARAGKALLLDKPVGLTLAQAEELAAVIDETGVISQLLLTNRYLDSMITFLDAASSFEAYGARAWFFGDGCLEGTFFGTPWRVAEGGLIDLAPHVLDALDAAMGPIVAIRARGQRRGMVSIECEHADGRYSQAAISNTTRQSGGLVVELHGPEGRLAFETNAATPEEKAADYAGAMQRVVGQFVQAVRTGTPHPLDVHRGVFLQRLIEQATEQTTP